MGYSKTFCIPEAKGLKSLFTGFGQNLFAFATVGLVFYNFH